MKNSVSTGTIIVLILVSFSTLPAEAEGPFRTFNDHGLVACRFVEMKDTPEWIGGVMVVVYDCADDGMEISRFLTVDRVFNRSAIDSQLARLAAVTLDPTVDFYATIGRLYFFRSLHSADTSPQIELP